MATALNITQQEFPILFEHLGAIEKSIPEYTGRSARQIASMLIIEACEAKLSSVKETQSSMTETKDTTNA